MGARVDRWEEHKRLKRAARAVAWGDRRAQPELDRRLAHKRAKLDPAPVPMYPVDPEKLAWAQEMTREMAESAEMERKFDYLRMMAALGRGRLF